MPINQAERIFFYSCVRSLKIPTDSEEMLDICIPWGIQAMCIPTKLELKISYIRLK